MQTRRAQTIATALAEWFGVVARDLSFRRTRDPYAIWVSEIMLQQTRVETVEGYFPRFIDRFPDVAALAAASEDEVLAAWSGLGYYRRARLLHRGARWLVEHRQGRLPRGAAALREIPGVGAYTAGAISAIAFDEPEPLVDGNVARVLSRLEGVEDPREQGANAPRHWRDAADIIAKGRPRVLAQALMELGATVCTPRAARCDVCPVARSCKAKSMGAVAAIPAVRERKASPTLHWLAPAMDVGVEGSSAWLMIRRPDDGLLARMWTLPFLPTRATTDEIDRGGTPDEATARAELLPALRELAAAGGARGAGKGWASLELRPATTVKHVFTHQTWQVHPWIVRGLTTEVANAIARASGASEIGTMGGGAVPVGGLPTLSRRLLAAVEAAASPARAEAVATPRRRGRARGGGVSP